MASTDINSGVKHLASSCGLDDALGKGSGLSPKASALEMDLTEDVVGVPMGSVLSEAAAVMETLAPAQLKP